VKSIVGEDEVRVESEFTAGKVKEPFLAGEVLGTINENAEAEDSDDSFD
jgi:hypothetical protein